MPDWFLPAIAGFAAGLCAGFGLAVWLALGLADRDFDRWSWLMPKRGSPGSHGRES